MQKQARHILLPLPRRAHWLVALSLPLALCLPVAVPVVAAAAPITASGSYQQVDFVPSNFRSADGVTLFDFTEHDSLSGTFSGTISNVAPKASIAPDGHTVIETTPTH